MNQEDLEQFAHQRQAVEIQRIDGLLAECQTRIDTILRAMEDCNHSVLLEWSEWMIKAVREDYAYKIDNTYRRNTEISSRVGAASYAFNSQKSNRENPRLIEIANVIRARGVMPIMHVQQPLLVYENAGNEF